MTLTITSGELTARIALKGAELLALTDTQGREWMTDGDPAYWTGHAPLLFPFVGALKDGGYWLDGARWPMRKHGFARDSQFAVIRHHDDHASLQLTPTPETRALYPFAFRLDMAFTLSARTLDMVATVHNEDACAMPFSFGYHPAFAWPLPGGGDRNAHRIVFERAEPHPLAQVDADGLLSAESRATPVHDGQFTLNDGLFTRDALIWTALNSRALRYQCETGAVAIDVGFPDSPALGIWTKPGARFVCIEPWAGHADPAAFNGDIRDKPLIQWLASGESRAFRLHCILSA